MQFGYLRYVKWNINNRYLESVVSEQFKRKVYSARFLPCIRPSQCQIDHCWCECMWADFKSRICLFMYTYMRVFTSCLEHRHTQRIVRCYRVEPNQHATLLSPFLNIDVATFTSSLYFSYCLNSTRNESVFVTVPSRFELSKNIDYVKREKSKEEKRDHNEKKSRDGRSKDDKPAYEDRKVRS